MAETVKHRRGRAWLIAGAALIMLGNTIAVVLHHRPKATASGPPQPTDLVAITAAHQAGDHARLIGLDTNDRLWSCRLDASLVCSWRPVLQPKLQ